MSLCVAEYPYFRFKSPDDSALCPQEVSSLGVSDKPSSESTLEIVRTTPKNVENEKVERERNGDEVLVGYYLKKIEGDISNPDKSAVLFISNKETFDSFSEKYGDGDKVNWDLVKEDWGGVEMRSSYLEGWVPFRAVIWNGEAISEIDVCGQDDEDAVFVIYGLSYCPYTIDVLDTLKALDIKHKSFMVKESEKEKYKNLHGLQTFPQVFLIGKDGKRHLIGGSTEFHDLLSKI